MTLNFRSAASLCVALSLCALLVVPGDFPGLSGEARLTLGVFALATAAWIGTPIDDTYIALGAGLALTVTGVISNDTLFGTLGDSTVWLLICAFVLAAAVTRTGLAGRAAAFLVSGARTVRQLAHLTTAALVVTTFAVPATSGRAALALPVFLALAKALADRKRLVVMLALLFPTVILLSAVATLIGAGAHLITVSVLWEATGDRIGFTEWLLLGLPLAIASSHLAAETVLLTTTRRADRRGAVRITVEDIQRHSEQPVTGPWSPAESRCALLLGTVVVLWCSEPLHRVSPAVVALIGAVVASSPALGTVRLKDALKTVPWSMLLFMAATMAMGVALSDSGAAKWLVSGLPAGVTPMVFLVVVVVISTAAHLVLQSRSARSSVLVPLVVAAAVGAGVNPVAAALASTAAAGFCHTLPASAKPVALFADIPGTPTYTPRDLLRLSAVLAPLTAALVVLFAVAVWPLLGVSLRP
ncbi:SLC13 family permease [Streptomyces ipomoeae]|uniref:Sodium:sulfate symporter transmembrane region n=1 Tax=Streptomyces ipomoeae 91-03 TaxID=698759 RepID=L1L0W6_9ACTN|nr:SLC13 family permease [Streptomyces ipomoeae]EKX66721.1 sodium:sulfate symporter transmembrane region [Streptomyces ipomoeae 91-03]MDX2695054.1 SLC13 family permease [Streptomyces ipomoeae]MDX2820547.1 SLC13 family permease [Streptomyces ipomoeae]MDX2840281.1 SLC13 family permease [Streptomyces ipomoeae]MDX2875428.1 SLC13 family permease [Streptomyces ipomoeae]